MATSPASSSLRRERSRQALLAAIETHGPVTRGRLTDVSGLSRSAVAVNVALLLKDGLLVEDDAPRAGRGRSSALLRRPSPTAGFVVGLDFGHMHLHTALADSAGVVLAERRLPVDVDNMAATALDAALTSVEALLIEAALAADDIVAIAAGVPGPVDQADHQISSTTILGSWSSLDAADELADRLGAPVTMGNDADMGALGEQRFGAARAFTDFLYVKASHGIGASLMLDGRQYRGTSGVAGEIGHSYVAGSTARCRCGKQGCLEAEVSVPEVRQQLARTHLGPALEAGTITLADAAHDPVGARVLADAGRMVGLTVAAGCNWLNPQAIVLGGELGTSGDPFVEGVRESIARHALPAAWRDLIVCSAELGERSEVLGAVACALGRRRT